MDTHLARDGESLEATTQALLAHLKDKALHTQEQQVERLQQLQAMLKELTAAQQQYADLIPTDDPLWQQLQDKVQEIQQQIHQISSLSLNSISSDAHSSQSGVIAHPLAISLSVWRQTGFLLGGIVLLLVATTAIAALRLSQTHRYSPGMPFVSDPSIPSIPANP